jgi:DNA-binding LytR/AlgR family response regulator
MFNLNQLKLRGDAMQGFKAQAFAMRMSASAVGSNGVQGATSITPAMLDKAVVPAVNGPSMVQRRDATDGSARQHLRIISRGRIIVVPVADIECFTAAANYVEIHAAGVTYTMRSTMNELQQKLSPKLFARIHRSTIVNLMHVKDCKSLRRGDSLIKLLSGRELVATRNHKDFYRALQEVS